MATVNAELAHRAVAVLDDLFPEDSHGFDAGKRYHRIWKESYGQRSVDFFIEPETGYILKAAGWARPAQGVRFAAEDPEVLELILRTEADRHGAWLYAR